MNSPNIFKAATAFVTKRGSRCPKNGRSFSMTVKMRAGFQDMKSHVVDQNLYLKPNEFQKRCLMMLGVFKRREDIPEYVSQRVIYKTWQTYRIKFYTNCTLFLYVGYLLHMIYDKDRRQKDKLKVAEEQAVIEEVNFKKWIASYESEMQRKLEYFQKMSAEQEQNKGK